MTIDVIGILNVIVLVGICVSCLVSVFASRILDSIVGLAAAGSFMAVEFLFLQAPDVAIAEAAVGAVLGTVLYVIALRRVMGRGRRK